MYCLGGGEIVGIGKREIPLPKYCCWKMLVPIGFIHTLIFHRVKEVKGYIIKCELDICTYKSIHLTYVHIKV